MNWLGSLTLMTIIAAFAAAMYASWRVATSLQRKKDEERQRAVEREQRQAARENMAAAKEEVSAIEASVLSADEKALNDRGLRWVKK